MIDKAARHKKIQNGFSLLEIMVVLLLVSVLSSVIVPFINISSDEDILLAQAEDIRFELQQLSSRSWIENTSYQIQMSRSGEWYVYQLVENTWKKDDVLLVVDDGIEYTSYSKALNGYSGKLANAAVVFFSSGEYTPFIITLSKASNTLNIEGDGLNELFIQ